MCELKKEGTFPSIRFKGFTDAWEQCKLRELIRKPVTDGPHETPNLVENGIPFISVEAIHDGIIDLDKCTVNKFNSLPFPSSFNSYMFINFGNDYNEIYNITNENKVVKFNLDESKFYGCGN